MLSTESRRAVELRIVDNIANQMVNAVADGNDDMAESLIREMVSFYRTAKLQNDVYHRLAYHDLLWIIE